MEQYQQEFIDFALELEVLKFGKFILKSGRKSPYFFNAGLFNKGEHITKLGYFYASAIEHNKLNFNVLFGPAYKGIPLAVATAISLNNDFNKNTSYSFNRKELKNHGEGGNIVGHPLKGDVLIIDDVITAGTAINEAVQIINNHKANLAGVIVALDRQEKGTDTKKSAINEINAKYNTNVVSIISLEHIIDYLKKQADTDLIKKIELYKKQYGV